MENWFIEVYPGGQMYLLDKRLSRDQLRKHVRRLIEKEDPTPIVVSGIPGTNVAQLTALVRLIKQTGWKKQVRCEVQRP